MSKVCKWPGCSVDVTHIWVCGTHQLAARAAHRQILALGFSKEIANAWAFRVAPLVILQQTSNSPWRLKDSIPRATVIRALQESGLKTWNCYKRLSNICGPVARDLQTDEFIRLIIREGEYLSAAEAAKEIGCTHRYLRHLLYEDRTPEILALARTRGDSSVHLGFNRSEIHKLAQAVANVSRRRVS
jgi:hypothetical protein